MAVSPHLVAFTCTGMDEIATAARARRERGPASVPGGPQYLSKGQSGRSQQKLEKWHLRQ